jgi:hypothetical protein
MMIGVSVSRPSMKKTPQRPVSNEPQARLARIRDFIFDELEAASDDEFDAIMGVDYNEISPEELVAAAEAQAKRNILDRAKTAVVDFWSNVAAANSGSTLDLRQSLDRFLLKNPDLLDNMILVARRGENWSEADLSQVVEYLRLLELLSDEHKDE